MIYYLTPYDTSTIKFSLNYIFYVAIFVFVFKLEVGRTKWRIENEGFNVVKEEMVCDGIPK